MRGFDVSDWDAPDEGRETADRFIEWSIKQGYIKLEFHELFQPDMFLVQEQPLPGNFKYKSIKDEFGSNVVM